MRTGWLAALAACALAACGGGDTKSETPRTADASGDTAAPADTGAIRIVGSSTVYPFTTLVAEQFKQRFGQFAAPIVESTGTGAGLELFCSGPGAATPDVTSASRRIKASEAALCAKNGVTDVVEIQVGIDGLALAQGRSAGELALSERDVYAALAAKPFGREQTARTWRDVNPVLPARVIEVLGPPPTSGTRDSFNELIIQEGCLAEPAMQTLKAKDDSAFKDVCTSLREDGRYVESGENDNLIVQKLASNPQAIGVFGYSFLEENIDKLKPVALQGVAPTSETIANFTYPGSRAIFIYVKGGRAQTKAGLREFLRAYASEGAWGPGGYLSKRGLIPSPDAIRARNAQYAQNLTPLDPSGLE